MCRYMGGKGKIGKEISNHIHSICEDAGLIDPTYFEPFVGMCGVMRHVNYSTRIACDKNEDIIMMWNSIQEGWLPPRYLDADQVNTLKNQDHPSDLRGFAAFGCSFGGVYFGSYLGRYKNGREEIDRSSRSIERVSKLVKDVNFIDARSYLDHSPHGMVIYCDPPYLKACKGVRGMRNFSGFDHDVFWETMRKWHNDGNVVIVSEFDAPDDFRCVWEKNTIKNVSHSNYVIEKLFMYEPN